MRNPSLKFFKINFHLYLLFSILSLLSITGCATRAYVSPSASIGLGGIYHKVERGQTLWRISKTYDVDLNEILRINSISDATRIEIGQLVFVPHQNKQKFIPPYKYSSEDFIWPVKGKVIASFGQTSNNMINKGINIRPYKSNDVVATRSGRVIFYADNFKGFGKTIIIDHGDEFSTVYTGTAEVFVKPGDNVFKGGLIAKVGSTDRYRTTYLHFEIRKNHIPQNPYFYLPN